MLSMINSPKTSGDHSRLPRDPPQRLALDVADFRTLTPITHVLSTPVAHPHSVANV